MHAPQIDAGRQHLRGPGRPPRVHRRVLVDTALLAGFPERALHTAPGHRGGGGRPREPTTTRGREDQDWMTGRDPRLAQPGQRPVRHGDSPNVPARPATDVDQQTRALTSGPRQRGPS